MSKKNDLEHTSTMLGSQDMKGSQRMVSVVEPYELPEGWKWVQQNEVCKLTDGEKRTGTEFPYLEVKYLRGKKEKDFVSIGKFIKAGTKVILVDGENSGEVFTVPEDGFMGSTFKALEISNVNENYLQYFIHTKKDLYRNNKKGSAIPHLDKKLFFTMPFPLPPTLAEQQRIVNRIESMFAKLDEAKEKAQNVVDGFETRKAAILHKAFTGELTAKWRKENGVSDDSWEEKTVGECCSEVKVGIVIKPTRYYTEEEMGIPAFRSANVRENHIDDFDWVYINAEGMKNEKRSIVHTNDVLVVRSGAPGTACVVTDQFDGYNAIDILIAVPTQDIINSYFLCYYTNSPMGKNIVAEKKRGLGLTHFNVKGYSATPIRIPSLIEQKEIVRILDTVLEKESRAKDASQTVLEQIALLKKSILARAFRGEL